MAEPDREYPFSTDAASAHRGVEDDPIAVRSPFLSMGQTASGRWPVLAVPGLIHGLAQPSPYDTGDPVGFAKQVASPVTGPLEAFSRLLGAGSYGDQDAAGKHAMVKDALSVAMVPNMPGAPAGSAGTMISLSGAKKLAGGKNPVLHADDLGGANRMAHAEREMTAGRMSPDEAWMQHGVGMTDGPRGPVPFTSVPTMGEGLVLPPGTRRFKGPLLDVFDDAALRRLAPESKDWRIEARIDPKMASPAEGVAIPAFGRFGVTARNAELLRSTGDHEIGAHAAAAADPAKSLPLGTNQRAAGSYMPPDRSTRNLDRHLAEYERLDAALDSGRFPKDVHGNPLTEADVLTRLGAALDRMTSSAAMANYLRDPGEVLARIEQQAQAMRRSGKNPFSVPLSEIDAYDLSSIGKAGADWNFGQHRPTVPGAGK